MAQMTEARKRANAKYQARTRFSKTLVLNRATDPELIAYLETVENFSGYVKKLILADIESKKKPISK